MLNFLSNILNNKKGQGMVEYALLIGLIAIVVIAVLILLGDEIAAIFQNIIDQIQGNVPAAPAP
jgi:pilus assembly protein Flp/PilA